MDPKNKYRRYGRQIALKDFGTDAQDKLFRAKVLVIGAGGLGCPALQYLAAAGTGKIGIADFDLVEISNLQRQTLYAVEDIGKPKASTAAEKLKSFNPEIQLEVFEVKLGTKNALDIIDEYDIVIDGTDNFETRYMVNDACVLLHKPLVYGAVLRYEGQAGVFNIPDKKTGVITNYRDLFPQPPKPETVPSCNEAGVLGLLPGMIGTIQAAETIKILTGIGIPLCNKIISYNILNNLFYEFQVSPSGNKNAIAPASKEEFKIFNYEWFCGYEGHLHEISCEELDAMRTKEDLSIIDVREPDELPAIHEFSYSTIPLSRFRESVSLIPAGNKIIFFCKSGRRSLTAVNMLLEKHPQCEAYSLKGGVDAWEEYIKTLTKGEISISI